MIQNRIYVTGIYGDAPKPGKLARKKNKAAIQKLKADRIAFQNEMSKYLYGSFGHVSAKNNLIETENLLSLFGVQL